MSTLPNNIVRWTIIAATIMCILSLFNLGVSGAFTGGLREQASLPATTGKQDAKTPVPVVKIDDIENGRVLIQGHLGVPVGTVVKISGSFKILDRKLAINKQHPRIQLVVHSVNGKQLEEALVFDDPFRQDKYALSESQLLKNKTVQTPQDFHAYEFLEFHGLPSEIFGGEAPMSSEEFGAKSRLVIHLLKLPDPDSDDTND